MRLESKTKSEEIEAARQIEIANSIASAEIARAETIRAKDAGVEETARVEAAAAVAIVDRISRAKTEEELIKYAATVEVFSQFVPQGYYDADGYFIETD